MQATATSPHSETSQLRVLYVGDLSPGTTSAQRFMAFRELGCIVHGIDVANAAHRTRDKQPWERVRRKLLGPRDWANANDQIAVALQRARFDAVWIDRGLTIEPHTLEAARRRQPACRIIGYSPDDMYARHNQSPQFRRHLPLYDLYFTTKSYGVVELKAMGCPDVAFCANAFDPRTHRPLPVTPADRLRFGGLAGFIGTWEPARSASLQQLASAGVPVRVWGNGWEHHRRPHPNLHIEGRALYGDDYALAICAFDINLCFLRKLNRDVQTQRSVEIPACGAFMLAERTDEHRALFEERCEAAYFANDRELVDATHYYLRHPNERQRIAAAGRGRCLRDGYSYTARLRVMLSRAGLEPVVER